MELIRYQLALSMCSEQPLGKRGEEILQLVDCRAGDEDPPTSGLGRPFSTGARNPCEQVEATTVPYSVTASTAS